MATVPACGWDPRYFFLPFGLPASNRAAFGRLGARTGRLSGSGANRFVERPVRSRSFDFPAWRSVTAPVGSGEMKRRAATGPGFFVF